MPPFQSAAVAQVFDAYPAPIKRKLLTLRSLVFEIAKAQGGGPLEETLKWGEPAYLTSASRSGSTIRMGWKKARPEQYAMYFNCQTTLIETFRTMFPHDFQFEGQRAIVFDTKAKVPKDSLAICVAAALTYHRK